MTHVQTDNHKPGDAAGRRDDFYFGMTVKTMIASILMAMIMFLSTQLPETKSYTAHLQLEIGWITLIFCLGWLTILFFNRKPNRTVSYMGLILTLFILACSSALMMFSPGGSAHFAHNQNYLMAQRALLFVENHTGDNQKMPTVVQLLGDSLFGRRYRAHIQQHEATTGCPVLTESMTVAELRAYVETFDPHCMDAAFGMRLPTVE